MCDTCNGAHTVACVNNETCICFDGFIGLTCSDRPTTIASSTGSSINVAAIVAGVLGAILFTVVIGLVILFIWKRRAKKKLSFSPSTSTTTSVPVVVPALYDISSSRRYSSATSCPTLTYHLYEELP